MQRSINKQSNVTNVNAQRQLSRRDKNRKQQIHNAENKFRGRLKIWQESDDNLLEKFLKRESNEIGSLPQRFSPRELRNRAEFLGLKLHSYREPLCENDRILCLNYEDEQCFNKLLALGFQKGEIYQLAEELGVREPIAPRGGSNTWSSQEIEILHREFPRHGAEIKALRDLGRSYSAIMIKAEKEGLTEC